MFTWLQNIQSIQKHNFPGGHTTKNYYGLHGTYNRLILWDIGEYCGILTVGCWRIRGMLENAMGYWRILWNIGKYCGLLENTVFSFVWVDVIVFLWIICLYSCCFSLSNSVAHMYVWSSKLRDAVWVRVFGIDSSNSPPDYAVVWPSRRW